MDWVLLRKFVLIAWTLIALTACGAGGGGGGIASGGTGGTGVSYGPVSDFGSVFVNGVEFNTTNSTVMLNGSPGPDEAMDPHRGLKVGMVVKLEGVFDGNGTTGTATSITFKNNLKGPVTSIDASILKMVVLGQNVIIDSQTAFADPTTTLATLVHGNVIEVSGLPDQNGDVHATFVELKAPSFVPGITEIGVRGTIQNLNPLPLVDTFQINDLIVDYTLATLPPGGLANGQFVEVKGTNLAGLVLLADSVALDDNSLGATDASVVQMQGFVTAMTSQSQFTVGVQPVQTTASTVFEGGMASDIALGKRVQVDGALAGGMLTATKISLR